MNDNYDITDIHLSALEEKILLKLNHLFDINSLYEISDYKPVTISKIIFNLKEKELINNDKITEKGEKMVHYLNFRNETISSFLNRFNINDTKCYKELKCVDLKILIAIKNLLML